MRIVFYSHTGSLGNGGAESLLGIVSRIAFKHKCLVITPDEGSLNVELSRRNISNKVLRFGWSSNFDNLLSFRNLLKSIGLIRSWILNLRTNKKLLKQHTIFLKNFKPDIVYSNTSVINMGVFVAKDIDIPHIWHLREFQFLDYKITPNFGWWYFKNVVNKSDIIIANSLALKNFYSNIVAPIKIKVVYNGIETNNIYLNRIIKPTFTFLMVGTLIEYKGQIDAIMAAKKLTDLGYDFKLDIVGGGKIKKKLNNLIKSLKLEEIVVLHGQSSDVETFYRKADCYLMCSKSEAFGRVTVEAMLHKMPVIGRISKYSATEEILRDQIDGLHYKDEDELVVKMEYMLKNKNKGIEMGLAGYERATNEFSLEKSIKKIENIILNVKSF